jgi:pyruvate-formate lyase-activating enzyme
MKSGKEKDSSKVKYLRKDVARILTLLNQKIQLEEVESILEKIKDSTKEVEVKVEGVEEKAEIKSEEVAQKAEAKEEVKVKEKAVIKKETKKVKAKKEVKKVSTKKPLKNHTHK